MLAKEITYTDYDGNVRTEKFYFNLNEVEIAELEFDQPGGLMAYMDMIRKANDKTEIIKICKKLIMKAYGEKSPDGRRLIKSDEISIAFTQTEAYNEIFKQILRNDIKIADFLFGILPSEWTKQAKNDPAIIKLIEEANKNAAD